LLWPEKEEDEQKGNKTTKNYPSTRERMRITMRKKKEQTKEKI
jgi:hypothetical protein